MFYYYGLILSWLKFFELYVGKDSINGAFGQNLLYCIAFLLPSWKILKYSRLEYSRHCLLLLNKNPSLDVTKKVTNTQASRIITCWCPKFLIQNIKISYGRHSSYFQIRMHHPFYGPSHHFIWVLLLLSWEIMN